MPTKTERASWELALKERRDKVLLAGPPAWLVEESRRKKDENVHEIAQRVRKELGLIR